MQSFHDMGQVGAGFYFAESAAFHDREQGCGVRCCVFGSDQHPVFSADDDHAKCSFDVVVVDGKFAAFGVNDEGGPVFDEEVEGFALSGSFGVVVARGVEQLMDDGQLGFGAFATKTRVDRNGRLAFQLFLVAQLPRLALHVIEFSDRGDEWSDD